MFKNTSTGQNNKKKNTMKWNEFLQIDVSQRALFGEDFWVLNYGINIFVISRINVKYQLTRTLNCILKKNILTSYLLYL